MSQQVATKQPFTGTWRAVPDTVADLRQRVAAVARRAGAPAESVSSIKLAVSEAVSNVVLHAYPGEPGEVHVRVEREQRTLLITVEDDGGGMLPRPDSPGLGLGLPLIAQLVDGLEVGRRQGGGTSLCMRFEI